MSDVETARKKIIVVEYPKSGGSWFVNMLGDTLGYAKRDIYIDDEGLAPFNLRTHPWYKDAAGFGLPESCVIKSHELPGSPLHNFPAEVIHLIRDGRDVAVSKYFYEKDFCVENRITSGFELTWDAFMEKTSSEWALFVTAWLAEDALIVHYEDLLRDAAAEVKRIISSLKLSVAEHMIHAAVQNNTKEAMRRTFENTFRHNTFVRKGVQGDWKNHFDQRHKVAVKRLAGDVLVALGYEKDNNW